MGLFGICTTILVNLHNRWGGGLMSGGQKGGIFESHETERKFWHMQQKLIYQQLLALFTSDDDTTASIRLFMSWQKEKNIYKRCTDALADCAEKYETGIT